MPSLQTYPDIYSGNAMTTLPASAPPPAHRQRSKLSSGLLFAVTTLFIVMGAAAPALPDFAAYEDIFDSGGGHLALLGRDPGFVWLIQRLDAFVSYSQFRWIALTTVAFVTLHSLWRYQCFAPHKLGAAMFLALSPLILLKFGAQIREGLALSLWLWMLLSHEQTPRTFLFTLAAAISISIHLAILPLWGLLGLYLYARRWPRMLMVIGTLLYAAFVYIVSDVSRLENELFRGLSDESVVPTLASTVYWLVFPCLFTFSLLRGDTGRRATSHAPLPVQSLAYIVRVTMIGALVGFGLQVLVTGAPLLQKGTVADSMRLASLLLMLYVIYLAISGRRRMACLVASFLIIDTVRIMLAA